MRLLEKPPLSPCCKAPVEMGLGLTDETYHHQPNLLIMDWTCGQCGQTGFVVWSPDETKALVEALKNA